MSGVTSSGDKLGPLRAGKVGSIQPQQQPCARCATSSTTGRGAGAGRPESRTGRCRDRCGTSLDAFSRVMVYCRAYNRARVDGISQEGIITGNINKGIIYTGITAGNIIAGNMTGKGFIVMIIEYFIVINCIISICATSSSARAPRHGQRQAHHHRPGDRHHLSSRNGISSKINSITTSSSSRMGMASSQSITGYHGHYHHGHHHGHHQHGQRDSHHHRFGGRHHFPPSSGIINKIISVATFPSSSIQASNNQSLIISVNRNGIMAQAAAVTLESSVWRAASFPAKFGHRQLQFSFVCVRWGSTLSQFEFRVEAPGVRRAGVTHRDILTVFIWCRDPCDMGVAAEAMIGSAWTRQLSVGLTSHRTLIFYNHNHNASTTQGTKKQTGS